MKKYYVYKIINPITNRIFYIGKGTGNRCKQHLTDKGDYCFNKRLNGYIRNLIQEKQIPIIEKIKENLDEIVAYELEESLIKEYGRVGFDENGILLNILESGRPPSFSGKDHPWYGRKHTEKTKKKISERQKELYLSGAVKPHNTGKPLSEETKNKLRIAMTGRVKTPETIQKTIDTRLKNNKPQTENQKQKAREANQKTWRIITPSGEEIIVLNLRQYSLDNGLDQGNMVHTANGRQKHCKGYRVFRV